jgi:23S rRNA (guanosine2251-2'-O)-methyltransferase
MSKNWPPKKDKPVVNLSGPLVIGRRTVIEVLRFKPEKIRRVFLVKEKEERASSEQMAEIISAIKRNSLNITEVTKDQLTTLAGSSSHQSVALELVQRNNSDFKSFVKKIDSVEKSVVLALDDVQDPNNLGAILRVAECFGVTAVIWSKNRSSGVTSAVTKTSVGASELIDWYEVSNLRDALLKLKEAGFWLVATAKTDKAQNIKNFDWPQKSVIIMGGEGLGISQLLLKDSDFHVWIPMTGRIESLNVSQATTIMLWEGTKNS